MELIALQAKKTVLAFGLTKWAQLDPFKSAHSQVVRWRHEGLTHAVRYQAGAETVYGLTGQALTPEELARYKGMRLVSGAAAAALLPQLRGKTALVTIEVAASLGVDPRVVVIGLERGIVTQDEVVSPDVVSDLRQRFSTRVNGDFEVHGQAFTIPQVNHALTLGDLAGKGSAKATITALRATRGALIAGGIAGFVVLLMASYMGWDAYRENARKLEQQKALMMNSPAVQYSRSVASLLATPVVPLHSAMQSMRAAVRDFPLVFEGWELAKFTCPVTGDCTVRFKRLHNIGATLEDFRARAPSSWTSIVPSGQEELTFNYKVAFESARLERAAWPEMVTMRDRNFNQWQYLEPAGWRAEFGALSLQAVPASLNATEVAALQSHPEAVRAMPVNITNMEWWFVDDDPNSPITHELLGSNTVLSGEIELLHANRSVTFNVKGLSYVR